MRPSFTPSATDFEARTRASFSAQSMMQTLGVELAEIGPGWVDLEFSRRDEFTQQHGYVHAGVFATVLDTACGFAAFTLMPGDAAVLTVEFKISLMRPGKPERYVASAEVVKPGRTLTFATATARDADTGAEIAALSATLMALVDRGIDG